MTRSRFDNLEEPHEIAPGRSAEELDRFARSEEDAVRVVLPSAEEQPFRRCPRCERDSTRFETVCPNCETRLDTPEALAFNAALWKRRLEEEALAKRERAARATQEDQAEDARAAAMHDVQAQLARDLESELGKGGPSLWNRLGRVVVGLALFELAFHAPFAPLRLALAAGGLVCLVAAIPARVWRRLGQTTRWGG